MTWYSTKAPFLGNKLLKVSYSGLYGLDRVIRSLVFLGNKAIDHSFRRKLFDPICHLGIMCDKKMLRSAPFKNTEV